MDCCPAYVATVGCAGRGPQAGVAERHPGVLQGVAHLDRNHAAGVRPGQDGAGRGWPAHVPKRTMTRKALTRKKLSETKNAVLTLR